MTPTPLPQSLDDIDRTWVQSILTDPDLLTHDMPSFTLEPLDAQCSTLARMVLGGDLTGSPFPRSMILKLCPDGLAFLGASEPNYYCRDYVTLAHAPLVQCHGLAAPDLATPESLGAGYALVLEDLGDTHSDNKFIKPDARHATRLADALARLHAHRWGRDADPDGPHDLPAEMERFLAHVAQGLGPIIDASGGDLGPSERQRLERLFTHDAPQMLQRARQGGGLTLLHGDPNPTNVLTGLTPLQPLYLIDRQPFPWTCRQGLGAADLIHAATPYWPPDVRRALEAPLLESYHATLLEAGVTGFTPADLREDWRVSAPMAAFTALEWGSNPHDLWAMKWLWEKQLHRALALLGDLGS